MTSNRPRPTASRRPGRPAGRTAADGPLADRDALLAAAERLIRNRGPEVSLRAIAAEAGVTKPILYRGVGDRDALIDALAERLSARLADQVARRVAPTSDPHDALRRLVGAYLAEAAADRHVYLFVTGGGSDRVHQSLRLADRTAQQFAQAISVYRTGGGADPAVSNVWAHGLVGALHQVTLWWLRGSTADIDLVADQITAMLWSGIGLE